MYKRYKQIDERDKRIYMAGLSFSQMLGYKTAREYCKNTVLAIGDIDDDLMIFFSNSIDRDVHHIEQGLDEKFTSFFTQSVETYVHPKYLDAAREFFSVAHLRKSFERGRMCESLEYPCQVLDDVIWIRACYELEQNEKDGHIIATVALIDISHLREGAEI